MTSVRRSIRSALRQRLAEYDTEKRIGLTEAAYETGAELRDMFVAVVKQWDTPVKFAVYVDVQPTAVMMTVEAEGEGKQIFNWVDEGTEGPYTIQPKDPNGYLVFQGGYSAYTQPTAQYNVGSGQANGDWAKVKSVRHPGIKARKFSETFRKQILPVFRRRIENTFRRKGR